MSWYEELEKAEERKLQQGRITASANMNYEPDRAARVWKAAARTKLPQQLVDADLENIEKRLETESFNYENYTDEVNGSPVFNRFAAENPYNYAVLERNRKNLTRLERTLQPIFQGWDSGWGMIEMAEIRDRQLKGDKRESDEARLKELRSLTEGSGDYFGVDSWYMKALVMTAQQVTIQSWLVGESLDEIGLGMAAGAMYGAATGTVGTPIGSTIGAGAGALAGGGAGFLAGRTEAAYRLERGLAYDEYMELGLDKKQSRMISEAVGIANAAAESIGLGALTKRLPGFRKIQGNVTDRVLGDLFTRPTFKQGLAKVAVQYGEGMATEIVTEIFQEATLMAGREYLKSQARAAGDVRPETMKMSPEEFWESVGHIAEATMYGTMLIGAAGPMMQMRADARAASNAKAQQQHLQTLGEAVQDEKLREESPEAWRALLKLWGKDGPVQEFRVRREAWRSYWQSKEIDPDEAAKELGLKDEQINGDAEDIVVPFDTFIDKIAPTEHFNALVPDIRVDPEAMTQRDGEVWISEKEDLTERVEAQLKEQFGAEVDQRVVKDVEDTLIARGDSPKAAKVQARLWGAVMTNFARKSNMDPMEMHKLRFKGIQSDVPASMQQGTTDMEIDPLIDALREQNYPAGRDIFGDSLIEMIKASGKIQDQGGELAGRDFGSHFPGVMSAAGMTHDAAAELAFEKGYITEYDLQQLYDAIDRELEGTPVYSRLAAVNEDLNELRQKMEQAAQFFESEGMDLKDMTNEQVREAIKGFRTFNQSDLEAWTRLFGMAMEEDPSLLTNLWRERPLVGEQQDFSSITFTDKFETPDGKTGEYSRTAQEDFNEAVNERNVLKQLMDCVNG